MSDFMGRGFASLFVGWIGLQSALQVPVRGPRACVNAVDFGVRVCCLYLFGVYLAT